MTKERFIQICEKNLDFYQDVDGFVYYWPDGGSCFNSHHLRIIADELDRRNEEWEKIIDLELS